MIKARPDKFIRMGASQVCVARTALPCMTGTVVKTNICVCKGFFARAVNIFRAKFCEALGAGCLMLKRFAFFYLCFQGFDRWQRPSEKRYCRIIAVYSRYVLF